MRSEPLPPHPKLPSAITFGLLGPTNAFAAHHHQGAPPRSLGPPQELKLCWELGSLLSAGRGCLSRGTGTPKSPTPREETMSAKAQVRLLPRKLAVKLKSISGEEDASASPGATLLLPG